MFGRVGSLGGLPSERSHLPGWLPRPTPTQQASRVLPPLRSPEAQAAAASSHNAWPRRCFPAGASHGSAGVTGACGSRAVLRFTSCSATHCPVPAVASEPSDTSEWTWVPWKKDTATSGKPHTLRTWVTQPHSEGEPTCTWQK